MGRLSTWMVLVEVKEAHTPLLMVQARLLIPRLRLVTPVVAEAGAVMLPLPLTTLQEPLPIAGKFPVS